jgi:hypothetical protein
MSEKKRTSVSLDRDVYEFLKSADINQSGLINELVKEYRDSDDRQLAALELRYEHTLAEAEDLQERADRKFDEAEEIKALLDEQREEAEESLQEAIDGVRQIKPNQRSVDNTAVEKWANHANTDPETLLQYV